MEPTAGRVETTAANTDKKEECMMERGINFLNELQKMKEEMDRVWNDLVDNAPGKREEETWQWFDKFPKFEGTGAGKFKIKSNKMMNPT